MQNCRHISKETNECIQFIVHQRNNTAQMQAQTLSNKDESTVNSNKTLITMLSR